MDQEILGEAPSAEVVEAGVIGRRKVRGADEPHSDPTAARIERGGSVRTRGEFGAVDLDSVLEELHHAAAVVAVPGLHGELVSGEEGDAGERGARDPAR